MRERERESEVETGEMKFERVGVRLGRKKKVRVRNRGEMKSEKKGE